MLCCVVCGVLCVESRIVMCVALWCGVCCGMYDVCVA